MPKAATCQAHLLDYHRRGGASGGRCIVIGPGFAESGNNPLSEEPERIISYDIETANAPDPFDVFTPDAIPRFPVRLLLLENCRRAMNRINNDNGPGAKWIRIGTNQTLSGSSRFEVTYREAGAVIDKFVFVRNGTQNRSASVPGKPS